MRLKWLRHRTFVTFVAVAVLIAAWNMYVQANDDGILTGMVVDANGQAASSATVTLSVRSLINRNVIAETSSDAAGKFSFRGHNHYAMYVEATKAGVGQSARQEIRLLFRNQNSSLDEALVLVSSELD